MDDFPVCPLCGATESTPDSDDPRVRYCCGCDAMLNVGGVDGVTMASLFSPYRGTGRGEECG
jgi:hypothetical protein